MKIHIPNKNYNYSKIIPELPDDCIVEVPGYFKEGDILPIKTIHLPEEVVNLVKPHAEQHRYTVDAALGNDIDLVIKAMLHDSMANWIEDDEKLEELAKLMLYYEQEWLPPEWKEWIPSKSELKKSKYWVSERDIAKKPFNFRKVKFPPDENLRSKAYIPDNAKFRII